MNWIFKLLILFLLMGCVDFDKRRNKSQSKITKEQKEKYDSVNNKFRITDRIINFDRVSSIRLGMNIDSVLNANNLDYVDYDDYGYHVFNEDTSFQLLIKSSYSDKSVARIEVLDSSFKLKNNIKIGTQLSDIKKIYPDLKLRFNHHDYCEEFLIYNSDSTSRITLRIDSNVDSVRYGKYDFEKSDIAIEYNTEGKIGSIILN